MLFKERKTYSVLRVLLVIAVKGKKNEFTPAWHSGARFPVSEVITDLFNDRYLSLDRSHQNGIEVYSVMITARGRDYLRNKINAAAATLLAVLALAVGIVALFLPRGQ